MPVTLSEKVRVMMHLPEGYTKVQLERFGSEDWDIPTSEIPHHLRRIGSRFLLQTTSVAGSAEAANMSPEEMRNVLQYSIREIQDE